LKIFFQNGLKQTGKIIQEIFTHMDDVTLMNENINQLKEDISQLKAELEERKAALPAHSVQPHQLIKIEELEEDISMKEEVLNALLTEGRDKQ
jgi:hypothetical protein